MNTTMFSVVAVATVLLLSSMGAAAQMRPACGDDPDKPGACFEEVGVGPGVIWCDDGVILFAVAEESEREIGRLNPNGTFAVHQDANIVPGGACPTGDFGICGTFEEPGPGVYYGQVSAKVNGFVFPGGQAACPFKATLKGMMFRDIGNGPEEIEIDTVLHFAKDRDSGSGCRLLQCRVFPVDTE